MQNGEWKPKKGDELKQRTKLFAIRVVKLVRALPSSLEGRCIANQLFRSATAVAANYRAVCRARSHADFISKLGIVIEETDESVFWMELIVELELLKESQVGSLIQEGNEILAIMIASSNSAKKTR